MRELDHDRNHPRPERTELSPSNGRLDRLDEIAESRAYNLGVADRHHEGVRDRRCKMIP